VSGKGFTLIELMIVVLVIGILAAIGIPNFILMQNRAREAAVKSNGHTCHVAVESYAAQNLGTYPPAATAEEDISASLPNGVIFINPFTGGPGLTIGAGPAEGMCDYLDPVALGIQHSYRINCYGSGVNNILTLSNGS
jgi:prepilin-type N-terminal cleavage/methylation domain-containing protein